MAENLNLKTVDTVDTRPFKKLVMTIGELPSSFIESMTYYELLAWFTNYLETIIIPTVNNNAEATKELQDLFTELKGFVDNYFDNLDVQEEIDNKLDEMAESGELQDIIVNYLNNYLLVIFPDYGMDGNDTLGDCSIIKTANKVIMIDTFIDSATTFSAIQETLFDNNIDKIDYFLISHYDADHYGNYQRLIASGLINNARIILPRAVVSGDINKTGNDIKNALEAAGLSWETADNETIEIDDNVTMKLFNASAEDYQHYIDAGETNYNNFSVVAEISILGKKILFTGDCLGNAMNYISSNYITTGGYELLKDCHHGLAGTSYDFAKKVSPNFVLVPCSAGMIKANLGYRSPQLNTWSVCTDKIYTQGCQNKYTTFKIGISETNVITDSVMSPEFGSDGYINLTVNSDTTESLRTGSTTYPYKNLAEASAFSPKKTRSKVSINVVKLDDSTTDVYFTDFDNLSIGFNNQTPANEIHFINCKKLELTNVNLTTTKIVIEDCESVTISNFTSTYNESDQIVVNRSNVLFDGTLTSSNTTECCIKFRYSNVRFAVSSISFTKTGNTRLLNGWGSTINFENTAINQFKALPFLDEVIFNNNAKRNVIQSLNIFTNLLSDSTGVTSGTLKESIANYSKVRIEYITRDGYQGCVESPIKSGENVIPICVQYPSAGMTDIYHQYLFVSINGTTLTTSRNLQVGLNISTSTTTSATNHQYITIKDVIGIIQ